MTGVQAIVFDLLVQRPVVHYDCTLCHSVHRWVLAQPHQDLLLLDLSRIFVQPVLPLSGSIDLNCGDKGLLFWVRGYEGACPAGACSSRAQLLVKNGSSLGFKVSFVQGSTRRRAWIKRWGKPTELRSTLRLDRRASAEGMPCFTAARFL